MNARTLSPILPTRLLALALSLSACQAGSAKIDGGGTIGGNDGGEGGNEGGEEAAWSVDPETLELPVVFVGQSAEATITLSNVSVADPLFDLELSSGGADDWLVDIDNASPPAGETATITLSLVPSDWGTYDATLLVTQLNDGSTALVTITASAQIDGDGDGFGSVETGGGDCDDANLEINPEAEETWYDGIDSNCDGADDYDQDGDGVTVDTDCDDTDPATYPGAPEIWYDGADQACDGGDDYDQDLDGYAVDVDCEDTDDTIFPGAADEWYDGVDSNCDGADDYDQDADGSQVDEDCDDTNPAAYPGAEEIWYNGVDEDCAGGNDYDRDEDGVDYPEDCNDQDPGTTGPEAEVVDGIDNDCSGVIDDFPIGDVSAGAVYGGSNQGLGDQNTMSLGGDLDGAGGDDIALGTIVSGSGYAWLLAGSVMVGADDLAANLDFATMNGSSSYVLGNLQSPQRDIDDDGVADLVTAAGGYGYGYAWIWWGAVASGNPYDADIYFSGDSSSDGLRAMSTGDIDGDGLLDGVTGSPNDGWSSGTYQTGNVAVFSELVTWDGSGGDISDADDQIHGSSSSDYLGYSVRIADWTGDGYADILAGAWGVDDGASGGGALYLFEGDSTLAWSDRANDADSMKIVGTTSGGGLGYDQLANPGDIDGDGTIDLIFGSEATGAAWGFYNDGDLSGDLSVSDADFSFVGTAGDFASALAYDTDIDRDGLLDVIIGDDGNDTAGSNAGAVWFFLGSGGFSVDRTSAEASGVIWGAAAGDALGTGIVGGGDADGDGQGDLLLGAAGSDEGASNGGAAYLLSSW